jgi:hypothetical protein
MEYFKYLYSDIIENLEEMDKFLNVLEPLILNKEDPNHLSRSITSNEIESVTKNLFKKKNPGLDKLTSEFHQTFKELTPMLFQLFYKIEIEEILPNSMKLVLL